MAKIYISATYADLKDYRAAVYAILRKLGHDVISMEDYVATDAYPLYKCLADVAACDLYIGLVGWRYGYIPDKDNPENKSITELEYRQAGAAKLPRLMFLVDKSAPWPDAFKDEVTGEGEGGKRIAALRAEIEREKLVSHFTTPEQLAGLVSVAVQKTPLNIANPFSGKAKVEFCDNLGPNWKKLANYFKIPPSDQRRFEQGDEGHDIWEWLEIRRKLRELPEACKVIDREDLAELLR
ncbi:MAG: DUF4062 domain-containing protein [Candidatus Competibacteraceae bacterium]